jgi:DNA-directed RNA polymerase subunit RPC12/RpoP
MAAEQLNTTTTELVKDDSNKWSCLDCLEVKSVSFQKLIEHMESAHSKKPSGRFCERCGTKFESKEELIIHNINEQCVRQLSTNNKCVKCSITFHSFRNLQAHVFLQHCQGNLPIKWCLYYCEICNKMFHNVDKFRLHQQVIHEVNLTNFTDRIVYKLKEALQYEEDAEDTANYVAKTLYTFCKLCCQKFTKRLDFRDHFKTQHVDLFETRKNSGKVREMFDDTIGFTYSPQEDIVPDTKIYVTCLVCNRTFTGRSGFQKHVKDHHQSDEVFLCRRCKVPFPTKYVMVEHRRTCLRTIPCDLCSLKFFSSATLKNHIALRHATADKPKSKVHEKVKQPDGSVKYKCDICDKCFGSNKSVYLHKDALHNTANPDETFPCSYEGCSYVARLSHNLTTHVGTQHCEKNHVCDQCGASFRGGNILKLHTIKHHTTDEKHGCDVCSKVFNNPITLKRHKVGSHADARYVCITCGKVFIRYSSFRFHQLHTHNEKRDFICPRCKKGFKIRPHLRRHMNKCCNGWTEHVLS